MWGDMSLWNVQSHCCILGTTLSRVFWQLTTPLKGGKGQWEALPSGDVTVKCDPVALKGDGNGLNGNEEALKGNEETLNGNEEALKGNEEALKGNQEAIRGEEEAFVCDGIR